MEAAPFRSSGISGCVPLSWRLWACGQRASVVQAQHGIVAGSTTPAGKAIPTDGGYRSSGRWSYGSFIEHSDWVLGNCVVQGPGRDADDSSPMLRLAFFPRGQVEVLDTWRVSGLRGTGSHDQTVNDVFVPEEYTLPLEGFSPPARQAGALYRVPLPTASASCVAVGSPGLPFRK